MCAFHFAAAFRFWKRRISVLVSFYASNLKVP